jgi:hypothetical protein
MKYHTQRRGRKIYTTTGAWRRINLIRRRDFKNEK